MTWWWLSPCDSTIQQGIGGSRPWCRTEILPLSDLYNWSVSFFRWSEVSKNDLTDQTWPSFIDKVCPSRVISCNGFTCTGLFWSTCRAQAWWHLMGDLKCVSSVVHLKPFCKSKTILKICEDLKICQRSATLARSLIEKLKLKCYDCVGFGGLWPSGAKCCTSIGLRLVLSIWQRADGPDVLIQGEHFFTPPSIWKTPHFPNQELLFYPTSPQVLHKQGTNQKENKTNEYMQLNSLLKEFLPLRSHYLIIWLHQMLRELVKGV